MNITFDQFAGLVTEWANGKSAQFKFYYPLKGGWEAWTQAEVAAYILSKDSTIDILREWSIYQNNNQRVDWLFNNQDPTVGNKIAIELKCQSFENRNTFTNGLAADEAKLAQANLKAAYQGCQTGVMGISFEPTATNWMQANNYVLVFKNADIAIGIKKLN
ncbi:MAG: hypothetical protein F6J92_39490 [Symploca sp. SIO1A3]|nr:hypothetical protein [Symploca sp. SIO1A3]